MNTDERARYRKLASDAERAAERFRAIDRGRSPDRRNARERAAWARYQKALDALMDFDRTHGAMLSVET